MVKCLFFFSCHWLLLEPLNIESSTFARLSFSLIRGVTAAGSPAHFCTNHCNYRHQIVYDISLPFCLENQYPQGFNLWHLMHACITGGEEKACRGPVTGLSKGTFDLMFSFYFLHQKISMVTVFSTNTAYQWNHHYCLSISKLEWRVIFWKLQQIFTCTHAVCDTCLKSLHLFYMDSTPHAIMVQFYLQVMTPWGGEYRPIFFQ